MKDQSFKQRFAAFAIGAMAILLRKTSPNSARKEAFAKRKLWSYIWLDLTIITTRYSSRGGESCTTLFTVSWPYPMCRA